MSQQLVSHSQNVGFSGGVPMVYSSPQKEDEEHQKHQEQEYGHRNLHHAYITPSMDTILHFETLASFFLAYMQSTGRVRKCAQTICPSNYNTKAISKAHHNTWARQQLNLSIGEAGSQVWEYCHVGRWSPEGKKLSSLASADD